MNTETNTETETKEQVPAIRTDSVVAYLSQLSAGLSQLASGMNTIVMDLNMQVDNINASLKKETTNEQEQVKEDATVCN
jgi:hypothetical protein